MNSASYEYRNMSARRGAQFVPIGMSTICWKTFPPKTTKMLSARNSNMLMMSSSVYLFFESECSLTKTYKTFQVAKRIFCHIHVILYYYSRNNCYGNIVVGYFVLLFKE